MKTFRVNVTQTIDITVDETKFDDAFMEGFRSSFFPFFELKDHAEHIAQLQARGIIEADSHGGDFIEGYGHSKEMGIVAIIHATDIEFEREIP
jgi:hypothetical protein